MTVKLAITSHPSLTCGHLLSWTSQQGAFLGEWVLCAFVQLLGAHCSFYRHVGLPRFWLHLSACIISKLPRDKAHTQQSNLALGLLNYGRVTLLYSEFFWVETRPITITVGKVSSQYVQSSWVHTRTNYKSKSEKAFSCLCMNSWGDMFKNMLHS